MGNAGDMGYGGYTISIAVYSACVHVLPPSAPEAAAAVSAPVPRFRIYSASGVFLRPSSTKSRFLTRVGLLRDTRTFKTCEVRVYQGDWSDLRLCMTATVDFMLASPSKDQDRSILRYSAQPSMPVTHYSQLRDDEDTYASREDLPPAGLKAFKEIFTPAHANMQSRSPPQSLWVQNAWGILKHARTTQDALPLVEKRGYDWMRAKERYTGGYAKQAGALAWLMDAAISFAPLSYSHRFLQDAAAASTLSFNLAYHDEEIHLDEKWHLREIRTTDGRWERTTGEAKIWVEDQEAGEGDGGAGMRCVATMTQSCVLKAKPQAPASKL